MDLIVLNCDSSVVHRFGGADSVLRFQQFVLVFGVRLLDENLEDVGRETYRLFSFIESWAPFIKIEIIFFVLLV